MLGIMLGPDSAGTPGARRLYAEAHPPRFTPTQEAPISGYRKLLQSDDAFERIIQAYEAEQLQADFDALHTPPVRRVAARTVVGYAVGLAFLVMLCVGLLGCGSPVELEPVEPCQHYRAVRTEHRDTLTVPAPSKYWLIHIKYTCE